MRQQKEYIKKYLYKFYNISVKIKRTFYSIKNRINPLTKSNTYIIMVKVTLYGQTALFCSAVFLPGMFSEKSVIILNNYSMILPSYSIGEDVYQKIEEFCAPYDTKAVMIGGKTALGAAEEKIRSSLASIDHGRYMVRRRILIRECFRIIRK